MASGIYIIHNTKSGQVYIGQAQDIRTRWMGHKSSLRLKSHRNCHLQADWDKYGAKVFKFKVLEYCPVEQLVEREQHFLDVYMTKGICYNIASDATAPMRGRKFTNRAVDIKAIPIPCNITDDEREALHTVAKSKGFPTISSFIRHCVMAKCEARLQVVVDDNRKRRTGS